MQLAGRREKYMYTNLNFHPQKGIMPKHVALIPDGGRRWAKQHGMTYKEGYLLSVKKIVVFFFLLYSHGIQYVSLYFASTQNFTRNEYEIKSFYEASFEGIQNELIPYAYSKNIEIKTVGNCDERYKMPEVEPMTLQTEKKLFICFNYSSFDEIESAFQKKSVNGGSFVNYLDIPYPVDILIRTGGAQTLSGFMLPQLAFARLFFLEKLFNDMTVEDIRDILSVYRKYNLKYGE